MREQTLNQSDIIEKNLEQLFKSVIKTPDFSRRESDHNSNKEIEPFQRSLSEDFDERGVINHIKYIEKFEVHKLNI